VTDHELRDLVSRTLKSSDPAQQLSVAARLVEEGRFESGRIIARRAITVLSEQEVPRLVRRQS
jgi:hypothetical protein